jgi:hypothetical protein
MHATIPAGFRLVGLAVLLLVSTCSASTAQETERRRRIEPPAAQAVPSEEPQDVIMFTLWALSIGSAPEPAADELSVNLADRVNDLPARFASIKEVQTLVGQLSVAGMLRKSREFRFTTLNGQSAHVQSGTNQPRIVATSIDSRPGRRSVGQPGRGRVNQPEQPAAVDQVEESSVVTNSIMYEQIGTVVQVTPRIDSSGTLQVSLDYNASDIEKAPGIVLSEITGREPLAAVKIVTQQLKSSVRLKSGAAVVVQNDSAQSVDDGSPQNVRQLIILAATVEPAVD